jgi:exportin-2 (importin alpha re-exporter)
MAAQVGAIAQLLDATLDPTLHRKGNTYLPISSIPYLLPKLHHANTVNKPPAENALKQEQTKSQYSLTLLNIVASEPLPVKTRLAAALAFKNFIRSNWVVSI